ncbi:MAG: c-type cytochrome [Chloroflexota bacterium]
MIKKIILSLSFIFVLAACSLADDVTPPPGFKPQVQSTLAPSQMPNAKVTPVDVSNAAPSSLPSPSLGAALYAKNCTRCHGVNGAGDGQLVAQIPFPLPNFTKPDLARTTTPQKWYGAITNGNLDRIMPPWQTLSDSERWNLVSYLYTLSTPPNQIESGRKVYESNCQSCHGSNGKGGVPEVKVDFTNQSYVVKKSNNDLFEAISKVTAHKLESVNESDRRTAIDYVRSLSYDVVPVVQANKGAVSGKISNGTPDGKVPADQPIVLNIFDNFQPTESITVTAKMDGAFIFNDVKMNDGRAFILSTKYNGITYVSDVGSVTAGTTTYDLPIQIFEVTNDSGAVRIEQMHIVFEFDSGNASVGELYVISNLGDRAYAAAKLGDPTLNFALPSGYKNLQFEDGDIGDRYKLTADGFADTQAVRPGASNYQIVSQYLLPYSDALTFTQKIFYTTNNLSILIPDVGVTLSGGGFTDMGVRDIQGTKFRTYTSNGAKAGDVIKFDLKGKPTLNANAAAPSSTTDTTTALIGGLALGLALSIVALYYWNTKNAQTPQSATVNVKHISKRRDELVAEIADLDEGFENGEYSEAEYKKEREKLKAELRRVMRNS